MDFPGPPWRLVGHAVDTLCLVSAGPVRSELPVGLRLWEPLPGATVGGLHLARYEAGSTLEYSELILIGGLALHGLRPGVWVSRIYVDNPASMADGRGIWGVPKELAQFAWDGEGGCVVRSPSDLVIATLRAGNGARCLPFWAAVPVVSRRDETLLGWWGRIWGGVAPVHARWHMPAGSPLAPYQLRPGRVGARMRRMTMVAGRPRVIGGG